jgi:hypothetical protein
MALPAKAADCHAGGICSILRAGPWSGPSPCGISPGFAPSHDTAPAPQSLSGTHDVGTRSEERPLGRSGGVSRRKARRQARRRVRTASGGSDASICTPTAEAACGQARHPRRPVRLGRSGVVTGARAFQRAAGNAPTQPTTTPCRPAGRGRTAAPPQRPRAGRVLLWQPPPARRTVPATASRRRAAAAPRGGRIRWNSPARGLWNSAARGH